MKKGNSVKRNFLLLLSAILLMNVLLQTNFVKAATNYSSDFLKTIELQDADGNPKTDFGYYDSIQIHYTWEIPNSSDLKAGDTMAFTLPEQLKIVTDLSFALKDDEGNTVGNVVATRATGEVVVTFTDYVEKKSNIKGNLNFWSNWNTNIIQGSEQVPIEFPVDGDYVTVPVDIGPKNQIGPNETLYKYGWADEKNPALINWVVRINYAKVSIDNAIYEDFIGPNQTLDFSSVRAFHGEFDANDNFTKGTQVPASAITQTSDGFKIAFGNLTDSVKVSYYTIATDGGVSSNYANKGILSGTNFVSKTIEVLTPTSGGSGSGEGTTGSVELTKTDNTAQRNPLENAEFKLVDSAGTTLQEGIKTGSDGKLTIANLKFDTYKLIETKAPVGYELDATPVEFTIDDTHQSLFVSKENAPITGSVTLEKLDSETKAKLAGAEFELQDAQGVTLQTGLKTTDEGILTITDLTLGEYQLVETKAPIGYLLDAAPVEFTITEETAKQALLVTKENTKIPETPTIPKVPNEPNEPLKPVIPSNSKTPNEPKISVISETPDKIVSADSASSPSALPKTGDSPYVNGLGLLLVVISASGLILFRRK
ncbi:LPXTG cell wall anchor domain-containing protein [Listeria sp. FSL L7-1517]|uniref:SpaA isopeptide-forming pilin-related protein n=1 Tax=Listeria immobilis TaxID=2713502 RepID=UPI00164CFC37|nr:SpaA isopeptide-forming pilin-related protein [Listeria immobilis]MBC6296736.1 LPXTG cell wall anchor domain-containing protein [Listeria immobilis]